MCIPAIESNCITSDPYQEIVTLACFVAYVYFSFCDGFGLRPARKIIWGIYFISFSALSVFAKGSYDLTLIISLSSLMAFILAFFQKLENKSTGRYK